MELGAILYLRGRGEQAKPVEETPVEEKPAEEEAKPLEEKSKEELEEEEVIEVKFAEEEAKPVEEKEVTPAEEKPMEETPKEAKPMEEPKEAKPMEETPKEAKPVEETPKEAKPMEETPKEANPVEETPKEAAIVRRAAAGSGSGAVPAGSGSGAVPAVSAVPTVSLGGAASSLSLPTDTPAALQALPPDVMKGFQMGIECQDPFLVMSQIVKDTDLPAAIRPAVWPSGINAFLNNMDPAENPFWVLFGYDVQRKCWQSQSYSYNEAPDLQAMKGQARELLDLVRYIDTSDWGLVYKIKWHAFLQGLSGLESNPAIFPCLPMIAWAWTKGFGYDSHIEVDSLGNHTTWSIPQFSAKHDFYQPGRDFLKAFKKFLLKAGIYAVQEVQSSPAVEQVVMKYTSPDIKTMNLQKIDAWLLQGKAPKTTGNFTSYDGMVPFFLDEEILQDELVMLEGEVHRLLTGDPFRLAQQHKLQTYYLGITKDWVLVASKPFDHVSQNQTLMLEKLVKDKKNSSDTKFEPEEKTAIHAPRTVEGFEVHGGIARVLHVKVYTPMISVKPRLLFLSWIFLPQRGS